MKILPVLNCQTTFNNPGIKKEQVSLNNNYKQCNSFAKIHCNYFSNINFTSTNIKLIEEMQKITNKKNYSFEEINVLFKQMTQKAQDNINNTVKKFENEGLTIENYLPACIKQPTLFYRIPETTEKNIRDLVKKFEKEGLVVEKYLSACIKQHVLFFQSPETVEKNIRDLVKLFEIEGLTVEKYLPSCVKQPSLFVQSPETIEKNVRDLVKKFEKEGLTVEKYLPSCVKQPSLFAQSPETVEKNIRDLVKLFEIEGLTVEKYLSVCIKQPSLFTQSYETIAGHIKAYQFVDKNLGGNGEIEKALKKKLSYSTSTIYLQNIIRPQIKMQSNELSNLKIDGIKPRLKKYFEENPNAQFKIKIIQNEMTDNFIKTMQEYSEKDLNKTDAFRYVIV